MALPSKSRVVKLEPGTRLGKYQIVRCIAVGGMAELYLARTTSIAGFEKLVVLKRILPQNSQNPAFVEMFLAEARLAATLQHQNIAQVYDIGLDDGVYFFTMEYVHGADLRRIGDELAERNAGMPLECIVAIITGVTAGLHYAHDKADQDGTSLNIVHRDISPQNVLVSFDGSIKVVDFGIAKAANNGNPTNTGSLKGKLAYMSPEQCQGHDLDRRSDIFSVGVLLWELSTCRRLFDAENEYQTLRMVIEEGARPPSSVVANYPPGLETIVMTALARDPAQRYPTAAAMRQALEDFAHEARLRLSAGVLTSFMEAVFGPKLDEWKAAKEQGEFFVEAHVLQTLAGQAAMEPEPPGAVTEIAPSPPDHMFADVQTELVPPLPPPSPDEPTHVTPTPGPLRATARVSAPPAPPARTPAPARPPSPTWEAPAASPSIPRTRRGGWLLLGFAIAVAGGIAVFYAGGFMSQEADEQAAPAGEPAAEPAPEPDVRPAPAVEPAVADTDDVAVDEDGATADGDDTGDATDNDEPEVEPEPKPAVAEVTKRAAKKKRRRTRRKKKKKWSDDSIFLPDPGQ